MEQLCQQLVCPLFCRLWTIPAFTCVPVRLCHLPRLVYTSLLLVVCIVVAAGGRNATLGLRSASGYFRRTSVVGLAVFTGYWYWYPLRCVAAGVQAAWQFLCN